MVTFKFEHSKTRAALDASLLTRLIAHITAFAVFRECIAVAMRKNYSLVLELFVDENDERHLLGGIRFAEDPVAMLIKRKLTGVYDNEAIVAVLQRMKEEMERL